MKMSATRRNWWFTNLLPWQKKNVAGVRNAQQLMSRIANRCVKEANWKKHLGSAVCGRSDMGSHHGDPYLNIIELSYSVHLLSISDHICQILPDFPAISPAPPRPVALCGPNSMCVLLRWWRRRVYPYGVSQFSGSAVFQIDYPIGSMVLLYMVTFCNIYHQYSPFMLAYIPDPMGMRLVRGWWKPLKLRCWSTWLDVDITALKLIVSWSCLNHFPLII
jgi:hypothetical protein